MQLKKFQGKKTDTQESPEPTINISSPNEELTPTIVNEEVVKAPVATPSQPNNMDIDTLTSQIEQLELDKKLLVIK